MNRERADNISVAGNKRSAMACAETGGHCRFSVLSEDRIRFHIFNNNSSALFVTGAASASADRLLLNLLEKCFIKSAAYFEAKNILLGAAQRQQTHIGVQHR